MDVTSTYATEAAQVTYESDRDRIARLLRDDIRVGTLAPGAQLPSAAKLATTHGVSQRTAQDAIGALKDEGIVYGRRGRGVFVGATVDVPTVEDRVTQLEETTSSLDDRTGLIEATLLEVLSHLGLPRPGETPSDRTTTREGDAEGHGHRDRAVGT